MANRKATFAKRQRETDLKDRAKAKDDRRAQKRTEVRPDKGPQIAWDEAVHAVTTDEDLPSLQTANEDGLVEGADEGADGGANNELAAGDNPDAAPRPGAPEADQPAPAPPKASSRASGGGAPGGASGSASSSAGASTGASGAASPGTAAGPAKPAPATKSGPMARPGTPASSPRR
ncbi:MAG TPA: hypothetical protein VH165_18675 [Kofleriaceae bacterium]|nr:hypothetical protein [Kofleriaceae bacterium]